MHLLSAWLLLVEYLAFLDSKWEFQHPKTLYTWKGACVWIPCRYTAPEQEQLIKFTLYHNSEYDGISKVYKGLILYENKVPGEFLPQQGRVRFLGDKIHNCSLSINPVQVNDSGHLGLRMMSMNDKWLEKIYLNVSETPLPPHIQLPPEIWELQEVTLTCLLNFACFGYPIQLRWSLGEPAVTSTTITTSNVLTQSQLTFQPQWTDHGKNLTCQLWNDTKVLCVDTVQLDVKHSPKLKIEVNPSETTVVEGKTVTMTCQIISSNPEYHTISWLKDGTLLKEQETLTLTLSTVTKEMSGKYRCQASNNIGTGKSDDVALEVQYAPEPSKVQILHSPAKEGDKVELTCISPAKPPPSNYTWFHNGKKVLGRTEEKFQISKVLLWHAGTYRCVAENSLGRGQVGQEADLDVQYPPKNVTTVIQNSTPIREGDSVTLYCIYNSSNPKVTQYEWSPKSSWNELSPGVLTIQKVAWDVTAITCAACNRWCSWASPVNLDVQYAPRDVRVQVSPHSEIRSGNQVLLRCDFSSSHPKDVHFFWKKNGSFLEEGRELSFDSISPEDAGNYSCLANNSIGQTTSKDWMLQVLYAPRSLRVSIAPGDRVMEGKKVALTCESDANPPPSHYTWFDWNNQNLHHAGKTLRLEPVEIQHSGAYWCQGANWLGTGESPPSTLTVYYSPVTIGRRTAMGIGLCLAILILVIWGFKLQRSWKRIQGQQELQENSSGQSFFVRNKKIRRAALSEASHSLGCYNPVMEDAISYAALRFPETDASRTGDAENSEMQGPPPNSDNTVTYSVVSPPNSDDMVTYSVVQTHQMGDYENVAAAFPEDEGIHYSELVHLGGGKRPRAQEDVEYVVLKH
ncbi:B-cell receptor CD22 [Cynocephalus volans]|uniref:B-cell receptor CD22 n=1 Tax=Cynocephalus volans TaxID=110931 RepID=UPI002FC5E746